MTTVAYRDGIIAADTASFDGQNTVCGVTKIAKHGNGLLCGGSGIAVEVAQILRAFPFLDDFDSFLEEMGALPPESPTEIMIVDKNGHVYISQMGGIFQMKTKFMAIGSGATVALGAMRMGASAVEAVKVAKEFDPYTNGRIEKLSL